MNAPILKHGSTFTATLLASATDRELAGTGAALVERVGSVRGAGVIVDVTALDILDSFAVRTLTNLAKMVRLRGADLVVVGVQPDVAFAMVQLGLGFDDTPAALDYEEGLHLLESRRTARSRRGV